MNNGDKEKRFAALRDFARDAPLESGVYLWRDAENNIIYVGKAKTLRNRLSSYFSGVKEPKTLALLKYAARIETIIVANEYEALLLENTLIKQHSPKYNINLKDGKTYPVIRITAEKFPRVFKTRSIIEDGSLYFGPFSNIQAVDTMLNLVEKHFLLRKCRILRKRENPCMYYHIRRCSAPCCQKVAEKEYGGYVERVKKIFSGGAESLIIELTRAMHTAASALNFERAGEIRDQIRAVEALADNAVSLVIDMDKDARDYIASASEGVLTTFAVFSMRGGKLIGRELFRSQSAANEEESLETFIISYYNAKCPPPPSIFTEQKWENEEKNGEKSQKKNIERWFSENFGVSPNIFTAESKRDAAALAMAKQNAREDLRKRVKERGAGPALAELMRVLGLKRLPETIEGFDIAQLDGKYPVASLITFKNGAPDRKNYRIFKLKTVIGIVDDFAAVREAVHRRYARTLREGKELPDLILIDGGVGQANAAKRALNALGIDRDIAGLAKRNEELWIPFAPEPIRLSERSEALKILQFVRDESHRFATSFNQKLRSEVVCFSVLESVDGVGSKKAAFIMKTYASLEKIAEAGDLAEKCGLSEEIALAVRTAAASALENRQNFFSKRNFSKNQNFSPRDGATLAAEAQADYHTDAE